MEVLSVDLANHLSSSPSRSQQEIAFKIKQTHNQTKLMQDDSEQLLTVYAFKQGPPFGSADFNPPLTPYQGLPLPSLSAEDWLDLNDAERLQENITAFSNLPEFLTAVKRQQEFLNPNDEQLRRFLESSTMQCLGLTVNLKSIMAAMEITPGPVEPAGLPEPGKTFLMKLSGYNVCQLYRQWVNRCKKDMALLATKYPV